MRSRKLFDRTQVVPVLGFLLLICAVLISGCGYAPDLVHPGAPEWIDHLWFIRFSVAELDYPQIRTITPDQKGEEIEFAWRKYGRRIWWERPFNTAVQWRFVLFSPDGKILCGGNKWRDLSETTQNCKLKDLKDYVNMPLSADIDFRLDGEQSDKENSPYRSIGRVIYLMEAYQYKYSP